jgi:hypothetical protein
MQGGLRKSVEIQKNANGNMKNLLKIDFSYLDKDDLMAMSTQSSIKMREYQNQRRILSAYPSKEIHTYSKNKDFEHF